MRYFLSVLLTLSLLTVAWAAVPYLGQPFMEWSMEHAIQILNDSPWARTESIARVIGGVGSGVSGEKEIYYTFYVRFLSARPIREAYTRVQLIQHGYDDLSVPEQQKFSDLIQERVELDFDRWIVVALSFRSNDPNEESRIRQYFQSQTTGTMKNNAFLSTANFAQVPLITYFPPREEGVGARFVFPREVEGVPLVTLDDRQITFELTSLPASATRGGGDGGRGGRGFGGGGRGRGRNRGGGGGGDNSPGGEDENTGILRALFDIRAMVTDGELSI